MRYISLGAAFVFFALFLYTYIKYSSESYKPPAPVKISKEEKVKQFKAMIKEMEELRKELEKDDGFTSTEEIAQLEMLFALRGLSGQIADFRSEMRVLLLFMIATVVGFGIAILAVRR